MMTPPRVGVTTAREHHGAGHHFRIYVDLMHETRLVAIFGIEVLELLSEYDLEDELRRLDLVERLAPLPVNAHLRQSRMAFRTAVMTQVLLDDPPETWRAVQRMLALGLDAETIFSQLGLVMAKDLSMRIASKPEFDAQAQDRSFAEMVSSLPLPTTEQIEARLVNAFRAEPGCDLDELVESIADSAGPNRELVQPIVDQVLDHLLDGPLQLLPDDRIVVIPDLISDAVFTHRVNELEIELDSLTVAFDLGAFSRIDRLTLVDGAEIEQYSLETNHLAWNVEPGWLDDYEPGDVLAISVELDADQSVGTGQLSGTVKIDKVDDSADLDDMTRAVVAVEAVRAAYDDLVKEPWLPVTGDELAWWLLHHRPTLFTRPQLPLSEIAVDAGLEFVAGRVAHDESVWRTGVFQQRLSLASRLVWDSEDLYPLATALRVLDDPDASPEDIGQALYDCAKPELLDVLADALFDHWLELGDVEFVRRADSPGRLFELVDRAIDTASRPREVACAQYLAAVLYERAAAPNVAEIHLQTANRALPRCGPIVYRLGWYRFDQGDARGALGHWQNLTESPSAVETIKRVLEPSSDRPKLGRNDPCWCGSGRKFKQCHQRNGSTPALPDRVGWLVQKASLWLENCTGVESDLVAELAMERASVDHDEIDAFGDEETDAVEAAFADPLVFDAALHEGELFKLFLRDRGPLLPDDEALLAASWMSVDRSVHEVVALEPGASMKLRNLGTGDVVDVRERALSEQAQVGDLYCARVVPDGASNQIIGGVFPVRAGQEAAVLALCDERDPHELCAWVGAASAPPRIVHRPGLIDEMFDRDRIQAVIDDLGADADMEQVKIALNAELSEQAQARWPDEQVPALGGMIPREAAADPTMRETLERLLLEFESRDAAGRDSAGLTAMSYDADALRRELGLDSSS